MWQRHGVLPSRVRRSDSGCVHVLLCVAVCPLPCHGLAPCFGLRNPVSLATLLVMRAVGIHLLEPPVGPGYYVTGVPGSRVAQAQCDPGDYCDGSGTARACPAGRYGDVAGLTNDSCSGECANGVLCVRQTTSAAGLPCPAGAFCLSGLAVPCPAGTYNPSTGIASASACLLCPANTYSSSPGATSEVECQACPEREGSNPGATACWPGILGALYACACHVLVCASL